LVFYRIGGWVESSPSGHASPLLLSFTSWPPEKSNLACADRLDQMVAVGARISPRPPHRSRRALLTHPSIGGLRTPAPGVRGATIMGPASANLHTTGPSLKSAFSQPVEQHSGWLVLFKDHCPQGGRGQRSDPGLHTTWRPHARSHAGGAPHSSKPSPPP
jgi:hypothetical protein